MKQIFTKMVYFFLIVGLGLFIWTLLPNVRIEETYFINSDSSLFQSKTRCDKVQELMEAKFSIIYPKIVRYDESDEILVKIEKPSLRKNNINKNYLNFCGVSLEVWIDGEGMLITPGEKIIETYSNNQTQSFRFEIFPVKDHLEKGTIWINAVFPNDNEAVFERIPMFAIPFAIQCQSFFGMPVRIIKILSLSLTLLAVVSCFFSKGSEGKS